jgi:hypothetical protein
MTSTTDASLDALIDEVRAAEASEANEARRNSTAVPRLHIGMEDPIAWVRLFGVDPDRYFTDPAYYLRCYLRQKLWVFRNFHDDVPITSYVPAWLGHYPEYTFFGIHLGVHPHGGPVIGTDHPMTRDPDPSLLSPVDFETSGWMPRARQWYEDLLGLADGRLSIGFMTWNRGGLDLAIQLRGYETFLLDTRERPEFVQALMGFLVEQRNAWYTAQAAYLGTQVGPTWVADDWMCVPYISPAIFAEFVLPHYKAIEAHHGVLGGLHSCGDQTPLLPYLLQVESLQSVEVSPWMDVAATLPLVPADKHLNIAVHPNEALVDSPAEMERKLRHRAGALAGTGRRFSLGTSGLTPLRGEQDFVRRANLWLDLAREAFS